VKGDRPLLLGGLVNLLLSAKVRECDLSFYFTKPRFLNEGERLGGVWRYVGRHVGAMRLLNVLPK
jgi:hypothetical protein